MNTAASIALVGTRQTAQKAVSSTSPPASGPAVTVVQDTSRPAVSASTQPACEPHRKGADPSTWPDLLLELVFEKLNIGDLVACGQVCHRWKRVAAGLPVQMHCLLHTYTPDHRRLMERALNLDFVRATLEPRSDSPASEPGHKPSALVDPVPSSQELLCRTLRRMLLTASFHPGVSSKSPVLSGTMQELLCSPDGRMIAAVRKASGAPGSMVSLWENAAELISCQPPQAPVNEQISRLAFSSDGAARLQILYKDGRVEIRHPQHGGAWHSVPGVRLCQSPVYKSVSSPNGERLAVVLSHSVRIYGERAQGGWQAEPELREDRPLGHSALADYDPDKIFMKFSADGCHFVFAIATQMAIWTRQENARWTIGKWHLSQRQIRAEPVFDPYSRLLVAPLCSDSNEGFSVLAMLVVLRREETSEGEVRWRHAQEPGPFQLPTLVSRAHPQTGYRIPVAFSPDGELMAYPHYMDCRLPSVLAIRDPGPGTGAVLLCEQDKVDSASYESVLSLQFSPNSRYLAVDTGGAITLWGRYECSPQWQFLRRIESGSPRTEVPFAFSPDGFHCATASVIEGRNTVHIWGPIRGGRYGYKLRGTMSSNISVRKVLFTPDATRLVIAVSCRELVQLNESGYKDFRIASRLYYWQLSPSRLARPVPVQEARSSLAD
ncbi:MAG: hypothetical protein OXC07_04365 [Kistimonas sp.]|nr:hypothetical protein [Kistimonas sp.]